MKTYRLIDVEWREMALQQTLKSLATVVYKSQSFPLVFGSFLHLKMLSVNNTDSKDIRFFLGAIITTTFLVIRIIFFCHSPGETVNLSLYSSSLICVWYDGVKEDILFKSNNICSQSSEKKDTNMRGWQGHVKESCSYKSQWSDCDVWSGDHEAVTSHDPLLPLKSLIYWRYVGHKMFLFVCVSVCVCLNIWHNQWIRADIHMWGEVRSDVPLNLLLS